MAKREGGGCGSGIKRVVGDVKVQKLNEVYETEKKIICACFMW